MLRFACWVVGKNICLNGGLIVMNPMVQFVKKSPFIRIQVFNVNMENLGFSDPCF